MLLLCISLIGAQNTINQVYVKENSISFFFYFLKDKSLNKIVPMSELCVCVCVHFIFPLPPRVITTAHSVHGDR